MTNLADSTSQPGPEAVSDSDILGQMIDSYFIEHADEVVVIPNSEQFLLRYLDLVQVNDDYAVIRQMDGLEQTDIDTVDTERKRITDAIDSYFTANSGDVLRIGKYDELPLRNIRLLPVVKSKLILVGTGTHTPDTE